MKVMEPEDKCRTCLLRYQCEGIQESMCKLGGYTYYAQDDKAMSGVNKQNNIDENEKLKAEIARLNVELEETRRQLVSICSKSMAVLKTQDAADTLVFKYAFVYSRELEHADAAQIAAILLNEFVLADRKRRKENG